MKSPGSRTTWFTRREPVWREAAFDRQAGHDAVALVEERVRQGLPPQSVVSVTGLIWTPALRAAAARGVLDRHPMFTAIEPDGVRMADGSFLAADVILWATGFRAELEHLAPLHLRGPGGGIAMDEPGSRPSHGSTWSATGRPRPPSVPTVPAGPPSRGSSRCWPVRDNLL